MSPGDRRGGVCGTLRPAVTGRAAHSPANSSAYGQHSPRRATTKGYLTARRLYSASQVDNQELWTSDTGFRTFPGVVPMTRRNAAMKELGCP